METDYDVIVAGGGTAGVIAAVQAGRAGAKTLLVEKTGQLGGTITSGGVNFPGIFHAWGKQVIKGIGWELVAKCVEECGETLPDFASQPSYHTAHHIIISSPVYAVLCDEAVLNSGTDLLLHAMPAGAKREKDVWNVTLCTKTGLESVSASVLVDCTGDANLTLLAGGSVCMHEETQPASLICGLSGYEPSELDFDTINRAFQTEIEKGTLRATDAGWNTEKPDVKRFLSKFGMNANHIAGTDAHTSRGRTQLETEGRISLLRMFRFLRTQPGLANICIDWMAPEAGVRETVTIIGETEITVEDYTSGRMWEDAVCFSYYPIDLHTIDGDGLDCRQLSEGTVATVPRGAMLSKDCPALITAGRCISSDRLSNSALRVQATCMATGQAAGTMAALCAQENKDPRELEMEEIYTLLQKHEAIVPG